MYNSRTFGKTNRSLSLRAGQDALRPLLFTHAGVVAMSYLIDFTRQGTVAAKLPSETVADLQASLGSLGRPGAS